MLAVRKNAYMGSGGGGGGSGSSLGQRFFLPLLPYAITIYFLRITEHMMGKDVYGFSQHHWAGSRWQPHGS